MFDVIMQAEIMVRCLFVYQYQVDLDRWVSLYRFLVVWSIEFVCINATSRTMFGFLNLYFCQISLGFGQKKLS
jgi:hypothetical protein